MGLSFFSFLLINYMKLITNNPNSNFKNKILNRNKILLVRKFGGLGDIFMHRPLYKEIKRQYPFCHLSVSVPNQYIDAISDLDCIDEIIEFKNIKKEDYGMCIDTSHACLLHEMKIAPFSDLHRTEIWAKHCDVEIENFDMDFKIDPKVLFYTKNKYIDLKENQILFSPISAMPQKNLLEHQTQWIKSIVEERGFELIGVHHEDDEIFNKSNIKIIKPNRIIDLIHITSTAKYIITVDTAMFHLAGGLKIPSTAIFTFTDHKTYGKFYKNISYVQKHRDDGEWDCGPCYNWCKCPKSSFHLKPCLTSITKKEIEISINNMLNNY